MSSASRLQESIRTEIDSLSPPAITGRRAFLAGGIATGFALAVQPVCAQTVIKTDAEGLEAGWVKVPAADISLDAYRAMPAKGGPFPVVLVVQEIFGVHEWVQDICRRLAKAGYLAIAPALYQRQGDPTKIESIAELQSKIVSKVPDAQVIQDLDATADWAAKHDGDARRMAITGFCWGGRIVWLYAAHNPQLKAGAAWYGRIEAPETQNNPKHPIDIAAELKVPVIGFYGGKDGGITVDSVEDMRKAVKAAGGKSELVIYPDAGHGFLADYRPSYNPAAGEDGWRKMLAWFKSNGVM